MLPRSAQANKSSQGKALHTLPGHADEVFALDWSPNGSAVASGGRDRVLKMYVTAASRMALLRPRARGHLLACIASYAWFTAGLTSFM